MIINYIAIPQHELIAPLCQQAMDLGFDGLIIETHCTPDKAWSDSAQQITPDVLNYILSLLIIRNEHQQIDEIVDFRRQIDEYDHQSEITILLYFKQIVTTKF